ncbi:GNAT family N-acetyltransferase [Collinsella ihumii]|uniref:GNAT family N-acetyltransferase n=1 Tax=Collinsella ihumii TaxID=1720204 RepID=UPI000B1BCF44|nr:GNAT family N-acetyltransferase [Collinsella ihumii]
MGEAWDIRMAREDDAPSIYRLVCELEGQQFVYDAFFRSFASQLSDPAVHCLVLEVDGRVAGYLNLRIDHHIHHARPTAEILELIVSAGERGAGLGARLVERARLLAQVVDEFYPTLTEQDKHARIEVPTGLTVLVDGDKMARVFNNVMKNAIAYSYEGSTILISAERVDAEVHIRFENQGDPIPAPKLKVIFEKFYRLDAARATNRGGAGLGLAIAKEIVVAHGGNIACESTPEHTVFTITLPDA